ncbi:L,D-transpeptidase family protein [Saxibacter everestensis]|uniref:L,D-transpeptidase family protein n=1 Tax=Saxibacter everestensis TaxID=2909229 RepID=A0ABY8QP41_9MICO|nr:L,D-transpeptidase family protein [Brevibacteriaceae bacterium ZFBP1038]
MILVKRTSLVSAAALSAVALLLTGCMASGPDPEAAGSSTPDDTSAPTTQAASPEQTPSDSAPPTSPEPDDSATQKPKDADDDSDARKDDAKKDEQQKKKQDAEKDEKQKADAKKAMLRPGDKGKKVAQLQKDLLAAGYWVSDTDGTFGATTQQAVYALQKTAGLGRDGVVGPKVKKALEKGTRPKAKSSSGHVVEVDIDRQLVLIVDDGKVSHILNTSTGSGRTYKNSAGGTSVAVTPRGKFTISRQIDGPRQSKLGYLWRPKYFNGGIALHGEYNNVPPYAASHGCVRLTDAAMNWVWKKDLAPIGTTVLVY